MDQEKEKNFVKRALALLIALAMLAGSLLGGVSEEAYAAEGSAASGNGWELDAGGLLTIQSDTGMTNWVSSSYGYKAQVKKVVLKDGVTSIGRSAFEGYSNLTSVEIPNSVTSIGSYAF